MFISGSQPVSPDTRDSQFTKAAFGTVSAPLWFPKTLSRHRLPAKCQGYSMACTQHAIARAAEYQDGIEITPTWGWARYCKRVNSSMPNGAEPRASMKIATEEGLLPQWEALYDFAIDHPSVIGQWGWSEKQILKDASETQKKASYIRIPFVNDYFDSVRIALIRGEHLSQVVMAFGPWCDGWSGKFIPTDAGQQLGWHAWVFMDFDTIDGVEYLIACNSYPDMGENGYQYFPRETVNRAFSMSGTGLYVFYDLTTEQIALAKQETPLGRIQRLIVQAWWMLTQKYGGMIKSWV